MPDSIVAALTEEGQELELRATADAHGWLFIQTPDGTWLSLHPGDVLRVLGDTWQEREEGRT